MASRAPPHPSRLSLTARPPCHWLTAPSLRGGRCAVTTTAVPPWWGRGAHARCTPSPPPPFPSLSSQRGRRGHVGGARIAAGFGARGACTRALLAHGCTQCNAMQRTARVCGTAVQGSRLRAHATAMRAPMGAACVQCASVPACVRCASVQWVPAQVQCENMRRCKRCLHMCNKHPRMCISSMEACLWATCTSAVHRGRHPTCTCAAVQWSPACMHGMGALH